MSPGEVAQWIFVALLAIACVAIVGILYITFWDDVIVRRRRLRPRPAIGAEGDAAALRTWEGDPEKRLDNDRWGMCNTGSGQRVNCWMGGIGCDVDHPAIRASFGLPIDRPPYWDRT